MATTHIFDGIKIEQRPDGYVNLTEISQISSKRLDNYFRSKSTKLFLYELENSLGSEGVIKRPLVEVREDSYSP